MNDDEIREKQRMLWPEVIGLVITKDGEKLNVCPVNYQAMSTVYEKPLTVCIGLGNQTQTLKTVLKTGEFVYAYPSKEQLKDALYCGTVSGNDVDKLPNTGFKFEASETVDTPALRGAVANYECKVVHHYDVGTYTVVLGEVQKIHTSGKSNLDKVYSLGGAYEQHDYGIIETVKSLQHGR